MNNPPRFRIITSPSTAKVSSSQAKALKKWPNVCRTCGGDGDVPLNEEDIDTCDDEAIAFCKDCIGNGKCPLCAGALPEDWKAQLQEVDEDMTCEHCGWEDGDDKVIK